jgi:hypothetical protein
LEEVTGGRQGKADALDRTEGRQDDRKARRRLEGQLGTQDRTAGRDGRADRDARQDVKTEDGRVNKEKKEDTRKQWNVPYVVDLFFSTAARAHVAATEAAFES